MEFKVSGFSLHEAYSDEVYIKPDPTIYDDGPQFITDLVDNIIPAVE